MRTTSGSAPDIPREQQAIRDKCFHPTGTFIEFEEQYIELSIPERFEEQVRLFPNRIAVKTKDHELTYDALNQESNRIARAILDQLGDGSEPVVLMLGQVVHDIAALLGTLKAGKFFLLVDSTLPSARIKDILEDSQAKGVVTDDDYFDTATELITEETKLINVQSIDQTVPTTNLNLPISPDSIAFIVYTSGSTGKPKGAIQCHRARLHHFRNRSNLLHVCAEDRWCLLSFSGSHYINVTLSALLQGAGLYPCDLRLEGVVGLADWLIDQEITMAFISSPVYRSFIDTLTGEEDFPNLRLIRLASQTVMSSDVESYKKHFSSDCILINGLSSAETGEIANYFMDKDSVLTGNTVPVGYPLDGLEVMVLDDEGQEVFHQVGEIAVKSRHVLIGYWRESDSTQASFSPVPDSGGNRVYLTGELGLMQLDGCLEHRGRKDFRTKIRGYSVELAEVESALIDVHPLKEAVVVVSEETESNTRLVAYLVPRGEFAPSTTELIRGLRERLPDYMIPSAFVVLDSLPLLPGGKVDRRALPTPNGARPELETTFLAPRTLLEKEVAGIWAEVLSLEQVGIHDNFLELGGDSLLAGRVVNRLIDTWKVDVPLRSLFESPTVADMTAIIELIIVGRADQEDYAQVEGLSDEEVRSLISNEC